MSRDRSVSVLTVGKMFDWHRSYDRMWSTNAMLEAVRLALKEHIR